MFVGNITSLLEFCLRNTYLLFSGKYHEQLEGVAMGSPIVANLFMESFKTKELNTPPNHPSLWLRYMDDTFVVQKSSHRNEFLNHRNSIEPNIKFTGKETRTNQSMPFLDTLVMSQHDITFQTLIFIFSVTETTLYDLNIVS